MLALEQYVILSIILLLIGLFGFISRRNLIVILISIEIMLNG
ncbi:MAG: NADH-quinone oxidoreductase subunit K, partial [Thermodesulfobacterium sp.]|nr:NADH-quinone oxidoreductase subunit K [Thermodesulfobacterium sp.]